MLAIEVAMKPRHIAVAALLLLAACAHDPITAARQAVANAATTQTVAINLLLKADDFAQSDIVARAKADKDIARGQKELEVYRIRRAVVEQAIAEASATTAAAAAVIPLVESGVKKQTELDSWLSQLVTAMAKLHDAVKAFGLMGL